MKTFIVSLQFLTRFSIYRGAYDERAYGRAPLFYPVVGLILGICWLLLYLAVSFLFPRPAIAALLVAGLVVFSGGLHLDGFMDTMDGVFSGRPREQMLEIMRDSRVGAFGVIGLAVLFLLKYSLLLSLPPLVVPRLLPVVPALSRWGMVYAIARFPYARPQGLGRLQADYTGGRELALATLQAVVAAALAGPAGMLLFLSALAAAHWLCRCFTHQLGGLTGDTYGAVNEILEVLLLLVACALGQAAGQYFAWPGGF
ncbi:adenosylcobinamide-GDP ribazoletransferase [Desulfotomaculum copahuensis]|uniref:Adenosylcobinamide-GDP ribazoletransferase n=1 Tax=Desulfotomaculum copahuensis TaxID=1838280 RepID=A0A1B7LJF9_9FIRM|nr:adenosylcobinamide-GDP ribazoletransferase [Desulfotomaculum copahuensis]OAT86707.1 cobalamin 5'-phosphate synthase [Desulfotomaculum copahuensis]